MVHLRKRLTAAIAALAISCTAVVMSAAPASAYTAGNVWVNFSNTMCTGGGYVYGIYWAVDNFSSGPAEGDWGDNRIYPRVRVGSGSYNTLSFTIKCKRWGWNVYKAGDGQRYLSPYASGLSYTYYSYF